MATTTDLYWPFDAGAGSNILESQWRSMARNWLRSGPIQGELNGFEVYADSSGMQVKVKTGKAWIAGHYCQNDAEKTLAIATYVSARFDLVILRVDFVNNRCELDVLQGSGGVSIPTLTQNTSMWEIALATVLVDTGSTIAAGKVADWRQFAAGIGAVGKVALASLPPGTTGLGTPQDGDLDYELDNNRLRVYEGSAWRYVAGKLVGADLRVSGTPSHGTSSSWLIIALTETGGYDSDAVHASTNGYLTIPEAGVYDITATISWAANSTGNRGIGIHQAGSAHSSGAPTYRLDQRAAIATNETIQTASRPLLCAAGDVISLVGFQSSGGALNVSDAFLSAYLRGYQS